MAEHQSSRGSRSPAHHVLIRTADVGRDDLEKDAVLDFLLVGGIPKLWEVDRLNLDDAGFHVCHATIVCHDRPPLDGISGYLAMPDRSKARARRYRFDFQIAPAATLKL